MVGSRSTSFAVSIAGALALSTVGCATPDLGPIPFFCNTGTPKCPDGYQCRAIGSFDFCIDENLPPPRQDGVSGVVPDGGAQVDGPWSASDTAIPPGKDVGTPTGDGPPPALAKLYVTEFMPNPNAVSDANGEYLEIHNPGPNPVNLQNWVLKDAGSDSHKITSTALTLPAGGYVVLGRSTNKSVNGGLDVPYAYTSFNLANTSDEIILVDPTGRTVDSIIYSTASGWTVPTGQSLSRVPVNADGNKPGNWCTEPSPWAGSGGDGGSPGAAARCRP